MTYKILQISEVDFSKISCGSPYINGQIVVVPLYYEKKTPLIVKLPELFCDTIYNDKITDIGLTVCGKNDEDMSYVINFFKLLDEFVVNNAKKNCKQWKLNINIRYKPLHLEVDNAIKNCPNGIIKLSIIDNDDFSTKIFNNKKQLLTKTELPDYINGNCYVKSIVEFSSIIINNGHDTGIYMRTHQLKVSQGHLNVIVLNDYAFSDSESENDVEENNFLNNQSNSDENLSTI